MCHVAAEMERQGFDLPLLIGGATTSRVHTAVKIHPNYRRGQAVYVNDASRAVGVVSALLSRETAAALLSATSAPNMPGSPRRMRAAKRTSSGCRSPTRAPMRCKLDWSGSYAPPVPRLLGTQTLRRYPDRRTHRLHRLVAVLRHLGAQRQISGDPRRRGRRRGGARPVRRRAGTCCGGWSTSTGSAPAP